MGQTLYLNDNKIRQFLAEIPTLKTRIMTHKQIKLMFETLLYGAMRVSEVLQIKPSSLINGKIKLKVTKGGKKRCECSKWSFMPTRLISVNENCPKCEGKGKYRIDVFAWVLPEIYDELQKFASTIKNDDLLFPISRVRAWQYANSILDCRTHTFRHSFITMMLEKEKFDIRDIMQKARHKSLQTTTTYIQKNVDYTMLKEIKNIERIK